MAWIESFSFFMSCPSDLSVIDMRGLFFPSNSNPDPVTLWNSPGDFHCLRRIQVIEKLIKRDLTAISQHHKFFSESAILSIASLGIAEHFIKASIRAPSSKHRSKHRTLSILCSFLTVITPRIQQLHFPPSQHPTNPQFTPSPWGEDVPNGINRQSLWRRVVQSLNSRPWTIIMALKCKKHAIDKSSKPLSIKRDILQDKIIISHRTTMMRHSTIRTMIQKKSTLSAKTQPTSATYSPFCKYSFWPG